MFLNRRTFLRSAGLASASLAFPGTKRLLADRATSASWRTFEVTTRVEVLKSSGTTRVWLPAPLVSDTPFQKTISSTFRAGGGSARMVKASSADNLGIIAADFPSGIKPVLTLTSRVATRNYLVDLSLPGQASKTSHAELEYFRRPTGCCQPTASLKLRLLKSLAARRPTWKRRGQFTNGSSIIPFEIRQLEAAASAISDLCWNPRIWAESVRI
jgi:hypothetical protein